MMSAPQYYPMVSQLDKKCVDFDTTSGDVFMAECSGSDTQQWLLQPAEEGEVLQPKGDFSRCLHYDLSDNQGNVKVWDCRYSTNQKWYWDGERVRSRFGFHAYCMDRDNETNKVLVQRCNVETSQKWIDAKATETTTTTTPKPPAHLQTTEDHTCMDYDTSTGRVFMAECTDSDTQYWQRDGPAIKSKNDPNACLHFDPSTWSTAKVKVHPCTFDRNQQWTHQNLQLRTEYGKKCMEYDTESKDVVMKKCKQGNQAQEWKAIRD